MAANVILGYSLLASYIVLLGLCLFYIREGIEGE